MALLDKKKILSLFFLNKRTSRIPESFRFTNTIFVHIPKCAGQSVGFGLYGHTVHHSKIASMFEVDPVFCRNAYKFAVVRDPVERFLSAYNYLKMGGRLESDKKLYERWLSGRTIDDFLLYLKEIAVDDMPELFHFHTQSSFVFSHNKSRLMVDRIYRVDQLDQLLRDFNLCSSLPAIVDNFPVYNQSNKLVSKLNQESEDIVRSLYQVDYKNFF